MSGSYYIDLYEHNARIRGETLVCVARQFECNTVNNPMMIKAMPCDRVVATSRRQGAKAYVYMPARVDLARGKPSDPLTDEWDVRRRLIGETIVCEGRNHDGPDKKKGSSAHRTNMVQMFGDYKEPAVASIDKPAPVYHEMLKRKEQTAK